MNTCAVSEEERRLPFICCCWICCCSFRLILLSLLVSSEWKSPLGVVGEETTRECDSMREFKGKKIFELDEAQLSWLWLPKSAQLNHAQIKRGLTFLNSMHYKAQHIPVPKLNDDMDSWIGYSRSFLTLTCKGTSLVMYSYVIELQCGVKLDISAVFTCFNYCNMHKNDRR